MEGYCEHGNDISSSIKGGKFLDQLNDYQFPDIFNISGIAQSGWTAGE
jgi:hypothetical protein